MIHDNLKLFLRLYHRPRAALAGIIDEGSLLFAAAAALLVAGLASVGLVAHLSGALAEASTPRPGASAPIPALPAAPLGLAAQTLAGSAFSEVFGLALLYVPTTLFLVTLFEPIGSFGVAFRRDYGSLLACALMAWAASHLPVAVVALGLPWWSSPLLILGLWALATLGFAGLMVLAVRTALGARFPSAIAATLLGAAGFLLAPYMALLASPFLLYWAYVYLRGDIGDVAFSFGARQSFKRYLEAATLNPRDAGAHYQLGLIHQRRHQLPEAIARFEKAVEIDPTELDAHYQLGRIAREQKRYQEAIRHFDAVVTRDEKFSRHEVWREIGATYLESGSLEHARWALEKYAAQRTHDPEGLYLLGEALAALGQAEEARQRFAACLEAADTTPAYRRREVGRWRRLAAQRLAAQRLAARPGPE